MAKPQDYRRHTFVITILGLVVIILASLGVIIIKNDNKSNSMPINKNLIKDGALKIASPAFNNNSLIPSKYTCDGADVNPPLEISGVPNSAKSLALAVDDPDAVGGAWVHWIIYNISPDLTKLAENFAGDIGTSGVNSFGKTGYGGPCPPPAGAHRYFFKLFALDAKLNLEKNGAEDFYKAIEGHIVGYAELVGLYSRSR